MREDSDEEDLVFDDCNAQSNFLKSLNNCSFRIYNANLPCVKMLLTLPMSSLQHSGSYERPDISAFSARARVTMQKQNLLGRAVLRIPSFMNSVSLYWGDNFGRQALTKKQKVKGIT